MSSQNLADRIQKLEKENSDLKVCNVSEKISS